ncbi:hypothetical protein CTH_2716 [Carboxydocella thermautotrophica]|nr:hypothetical protein CTH_2716 [Carboxydocella thermautotrophica]
MRKIAILILMFMLIFTTSIPAFAYKLAGWKWRDPKSITYSFHSSATNNMRTAANNAANEWIKASTKISMTYDSSGNGKVIIMGANDGPTTVDGYFKPTYEFLSTTYIKGGTIRINTYYSEKYSSTTYQALLGHEQGHVFGLGDEPNESYRCLMIPTTKVRAYYTYIPRSDDINGINAIYQ